jgi:hypothetical protein
MQSRLNAVKQTRKADPAFHYSLSYLLKPFVQPPSLLVDDRLVDLHDHDAIIPDT